MAANESTRRSLHSREVAARNENLARLLRDDPDAARYLAFALGVEPTIDNLYAIFGSGDVGQEPASRGSAGLGPCHSPHKFSA